MRKLLLVYLLALPAVAQPRAYSASLGPTESVLLIMEEKHQCKLVWHESYQKVQATATGSYDRDGQNFDLHVDKVTFLGSKEGDSFDLEIRRKGVEGPPPTLKVQAGQVLHLQIVSSGDSLQLRRPPDWELTFYRKDQ